MKGKAANEKKSSCKREMLWKFGLDWRDEMKKERRSV
jgi:hypothetical protein